MLVLIVVEVGLITPVGLNLFVINKLAKDIPLRDSFIGVIPFVLSDIVRVVILAMFPAVTLFAVELLF